MKRLGILLTLLISAAPAHGATLRGGSYAWLSRPAEQTPRGAEEWEAFLSIDGGAHFVFRITPHLDLALQPVTWLVPNVDTVDARILIRTGDEKNEREFVLPYSFSIERDRRESLPLPRIAVRGEAEPGVVQWVEGDRAGTRFAEVVNIVLPGAMESLHNVSVTDSAPVDAPKRIRAVAVSSWGTAAHGGARRGGPRRSTELPDDLLLKIHRQNI